MAITVISLNSRSGGTGKTSIGLSAAAQLAARGKKVAFVDMDATGSDLAQRLPFAGVVVPDGMHLKFQFEDTSVKPGPYRDRSYLFWWLIGRPQTYRRSISQAGEHLLVSAACAEIAHENRVTAPLGRMAENLMIFPASCYVSDQDAVNRMLLGLETQHGYERFLTRLCVALWQDKYQFVFVDNPPGLSLNGAMGLSWAIRLRPHRQSEMRVQAWFSTLPNWWEPGLLAYEMNVFRKDIEGVDPVIIVNRVPTGKWLGLPAGACVDTRDLWHHKEAAACREKLTSLLFHIPLWLGAERDTGELLLDYIVLPRCRIAALREDAAIGLAASDSGVNVNSAPPEDGPRRWGRRVEAFFERFFIPAVSTRGVWGAAQGTLSPFHESVWSALVEPLLRE